jgi:hypothetical protein
MLRQNISFDAHEPWLVPPQSFQVYTPYSIHHTPYTIHHTLYTIQHPPYTIHHTASTIHYTLYSIHHTPSTIHHPPYTIHHTPYTIHHTPYTIHHAPYTIHHTPHTIHHTPYTIHYTHTLLPGPDAQGAQVKPEQPWPVAALTSPTNSVCSLCLYAILYIYTVPMRLQSGRKRKASSPMRGGQDLNQEMRFRAFARITKRSTSFFLQRIFFACYKA